MTAGSTFVGQFTDHDITFDQTSQLGVPQNPLISPNTRTPALDLDSVFGGGPGVRPDLYVPNPDGSVGPKLKIGTGGVHEDVPRVANGDGTYSAMLGDPRNDENVMIAGLHCAHILFYNRVLDELRRASTCARFPAARGADLSPPLRRVPGRPRGHAVALPVAAGQRAPAADRRPGDGQRRASATATGSTGRRQRDAFMPIEFGAAAYRFGHSMVRPSYRANFTSGTGDSTNPTANPFFALVFDPNEPDFSAPVSHDRDDLLGGYPAPRRYIGWQTFFDFGDGQVKNNKKIDTTISSVLFTLPLPAIAPHTQTAQPCCRSATCCASSPGGCRPARRRRSDGRPARSARATSPTSPAYTRRSARSTPLWYYILAEAKATTGGLNLGPVGGRIVAETLIGLLRADPTSYLSVYPRFQPFLGTDLPLGPNPTRTSPETAPTPAPTSSTTQASSHPEPTDDGPATVTAVRPSCRRRRHAL